MTSVIQQAAARCALPPAAARRTTRTSAGVSQRALAAAVGVSPAAVGSWESGRSNPRGERLVRYVTVLADLAEVVDAMRTGSEQEQ